MPRSTRRGVPLVGIDDGVDVLLVPVRRQALLDLRLDGRDVDARVARLEVDVGAALLHCSDSMETFPAGSMQPIAYRQAISCGMTRGPSCARGATVHPASNAPSIVAPAAAAMTARILIGPSHHMGAGDPSGSAAMTGTNASCLGRSPSPAVRPRRRRPSHGRTCVHIQAGVERSSDTCSAGSWCITASRAPSCPAPGTPSATAAAYESAR